MSSLILVLVTGVGLGALNFIVASGLSLIYAFIVVVIGGFGSIGGTAVAAVVVGLVQQLANFYLAAGVGDVSVVLLLAAVLLVRPAGLAGRTA